METQNLKLIEVLMARFCHDIIGPIGAINNGSEFFRDEFPETKSQAVDLIESSGKEAVARVQFYRQAYGSLPAGTADYEEMKDLVEKFFATTKVKVQWQLEENFEASNIQKKLILNLLILASGSLIRGGNINVTLGSKNITLIASGDRAIFNENLSAIMQTGNIKETLDPKNVQALFTWQICQENNLKLDVTIDKDKITFTVKT